MDNIKIGEIIFLTIAIFGFIKFAIDQFTSLPGEADSTGKYLCVIGAAGFAILSCIKENFPDQIKIPLIIVYGVLMLFFITDVISRTK